MIYIVIQLDLIQMSICNPDGELCNIWPIHSTLQVVSKLPCSHCIILLSNFFPSYNLPLVLKFHLTKKGLICETYYLKITKSTFQTLSQKWPVLSCMEMNRRTSFYTLYLTQSCSYSFSFWYICSGLFQLSITSSKTHISKCRTLFCTATDNAANWCSS